jgi:hypothetical protein
MVIADAGVFAYAPGEEVVARLEGLAAWEVEGRRRVPPGCLPSWTIGVVVGRRSAGAGGQYLLQFRRHGLRCLCLVPERAIDGTA